MNPLIFTILYLGYTPRLATERADCAEPRITKIIELIKSSKFGIHDLSRIKASRKGELSRLNMPFELGLDYGCHAYYGKRGKTKKCLILEKEQHRFKAALSDISNSDIRAHNDDPGTMVSQVRNWLVQEGNIELAASPNVIWYGFNDFSAKLYDTLTAQNFSKLDIDNLPFTELLLYMQKWIDSNIKPAN